MLGKRLMRTCLNLRWALLLLPALFFFNNCSQWPSGFEVQGSSARGGFLTFASLNNSFQSQALGILQSNCSGCHTDSAGPAGIFNLTSPAHLVSSGLVVPGQPSQSELYTVIASGSMPQGGALSASDQAVIYNWIATVSSSGGSSGGGGGDGGGTDPTPTPTPVSSITAQPTFSSINTNVLQTQCVSCHSGASPAGGYNFTTYAGVRTAIDTDSPSFSLLYTKISSGQMPPAPATQLSSDLANVVLQWIENGAPNN